MKCEVCGKEARHAYYFYVGEGKSETGAYKAGTITKSNIYTNVRQTGGFPVCRKCAFQLRTILWVSILPIIYLVLIASMLWRGSFEAAFAEMGAFFYIFSGMVAICVLLIVLSIREYAKDERNDEGAAEKLIRTYKKEHRKSIQPGTVFLTPNQWKKIQSNAK